MRGWSTRTTETRSLWCILWTCIVGRRIVPTGRILLLIGLCALTIPKHYVCHLHRPYTIWSTIIWFPLQIVQSGQYILVISLVTCQVLLTDTLLTLCREGCSYHKESIPEIGCCPTQTKRRCPSPAMKWLGSCIFVNVESKVNAEWTFKMLSESSVSIYGVVRHLSVGSVSPHKVLCKHGCALIDRLFPVSRF